MTKQSLHLFDDFEFGRGGPYSWPGDIHEARRFLAQCDNLKSSANYLECEFYNPNNVKDVRKRFKGAAEWPLPYLVASAAYCFLAWRNRTAEKVCNVGRIEAFDWENLFVLLLTVGEPLFEMIKRNGWAESNRESIKEGFRQELSIVIGLADLESRYLQVRWFREKGVSWFQIDRTEEEVYLGRCYPENLLGCLALAGVNETVARLAVREVFETESLSPLLNALSPATDTDFTPPPPTTDEEFITMTKQSLHTVEDKEFGTGGPYAWPGNFEEADEFLDVCTLIESSGECLEFEFYEEEDAEDVRERFKGVTEWPLPYLVASAVYCFLAWRNRMGERIWNVGRIEAFDWKKLFSVLLTVGEPLFEMIKRNGWAELNKESIKEGFVRYLQLVIRLDDRKSQYMQIQWFHEKEGSWFQIGAKKGRVFSKNLLGCLALAGVNETVARLAVREVFETETLYPFYTALLSATDTDFAASPSTIDLPVTDERGFSRMRHVKKDSKNEWQGGDLIQSTFFKAALAIVFVTVFCLPRRPLVSRALSFCRDFHFVALVNQPGPPFAMIYSRSTVPVKTTTGEVQEETLCSHVKIHRQFTGKVVIPRSLSESRLRTRAQRPIRLGCFADLRPENRPFVGKQREPLGRQEIPMPFFCIANLYGESNDTLLTHPDEDILYHEYCDTVIEDTVIEGTILDENQSNESNSQSESDSVADLLVDPISLEEISQLVPDELAESSQLPRSSVFIKTGKGVVIEPLARDFESTLASDLRASLQVSEATQTQETTDTTVVEKAPLFNEFLNLPLSREAEEYLAKQPLQVFQRTKSKLAAAGIDPDRLLSSQSSVDRSELASVLSSEPSLDSNGNARVKTGFVAVKHLHLTKNSPELAALRQKLPLDSKINVVVAIQRGRGGVGKIVRVGLDETVCQQCNVEEIVDLFKNRFEIDGQKHRIAPFDKNHLTLTAVGLPYDLRSKGTNGSDQSFVMLLPKSLHDLHTAWWRDAGPRYDFRNRNQTVEDFYSAIREHDCNLWLKHEDKLAAYGLTPQDIIEAIKHGHRLDNMMMDLKIKSE